MTLSVHRLPNGGPPVSTGSISFERKPSPSYYSPVTSIALARRKVYIGTGYGLAEFSQGLKKARMITETDGLPGAHISSLASYDDKLYMGLGTRSHGKSGLACYDPKDGTSRLIASSSATEIRSGLDGGKNYRIHGIVADPRRKCLWLGVDVYTLPTDRIGLWRYVPDRGKLEQALATGHPTRFKSLGWSGDSLLCRMHASVFLVDPDRLSMTWLITQNLSFSPSGCEGPPVFGNPGVDIWPATFDGELLLTGGRGPLRLHRKGHPPAPNRKIRYVKFLHPTRFGILAMNAAGKGWLIQRKK